MAHSESYIHVNNMIMIIIMIVTVMIASSLVSRRQMNAASSTLPTKWEYEYLHCRGIISWVDEKYLHFLGML